MSPEIVGFDRRAEAFARLNYQWIEQHFAVEAEDRRALDHPFEYAIALAAKYSSPCWPRGGLWSAAEVCRRNRWGEFELAKMAVQPAHQGQGIGRLLLEQNEYAR